jgi:tRNA(Ile)-lysidine synthase
MEFFLKVCYSMRTFSSQFRHRFLEFLREKGLAKDGAHLTLAVSGGVDSMVMLRLVESIVEEKQLTIVVAHFNHNLRGEESDRDEAFVRSYCVERGIRYFCESGDVKAYAHEHKLPLTMAARELRYAFLERVRSTEGMHSIATAHHADDNAETVLMNVLRGTGIRGLVGIPVRHEDGRIIRPMLFGTRNEIEQYAKEEGVHFVEDSSNQSNVYSRNYLRHEVLPMVEEHGYPGARVSLNRISTMMTELEHYVRGELDRLMPEIVSHTAHRTVNVQISRLLALPRFLQSELLFKVLSELGLEVQATTVESTLSLCVMETGSVIDLGDHVQALRDRDAVVLSRLMPEETYAIRVEPDGNYTTGDFRLSVSAAEPKPEPPVFHSGVEIVDAGRLAFPLTLRTWRDGDWFMPLGLGGRKKISDYFIDRKVSLRDKRKFPVLESNGDIVWLCGLRLDERFSVQPQTRTIVTLRYERT